MFEPLITNDAPVLGILLLCLAFLFYTADLNGFKKVYKIIPLLLLAYFLPAIIGSLGIIAPHWYDMEASLALLDSLGIAAGPHDYADIIQNMLKEGTLSKAQVKPLEGHSQLYFVASRYLLPASLILLTLSTDLKAIFSLGPKALIMFFTATLGIVIGGPLALWLVSMLDPTLLNANGENSIWRGLATVASFLAR